MDEQKSEMMPIMVYNLRYDKKYNARFTLILIKMLGGYKIA